MMRRRGWFGVLLAITFAIYAPSLTNQFALDDAFVAKAALPPPQDTANPLISELQPVSRYFLTNYWHGAGRGGQLYRPITIWSYALTHAAFGSGDNEALPHHSFNVLLHLLAVWLAYRAGRRTEARQHLDAALAIDPGLKEASDLRHRWR
ncbi:MAG: hypothetical protein CMJ85_00060 [Planctomycetes bacterium]|nr:hypothetical protein [Planctomycetota bacterium]